MRNDFPISYISFSFTAQSTGVGCDHTIEKPVHALAGDHQEENRGTDRARVSGTDARGQKGLCVFSLKFQAQKKTEWWIAISDIYRNALPDTRTRTRTHTHTPHTHATVTHSSTTQKRPHPKTPVVKLFVFRIHSTLITT